MQPLLAILFSFALLFRSFPLEAMDPLQLLDQPELTEAVLENLAQSWLISAGNAELKSMERDRAFSKLWNRGGDTVRGALAVSIATAALVSPDEKRRIFQWRYEREIRPLTAAATDLMTVRKSVQQARALIQNLFPSPSDLRNSIVEEVGSELLTNPAETDFLYSLCTPQDSWYSAQGIRLLELPLDAWNLVESERKALAVFNYFIGNSSLETAVEVLETGLRKPVLMRLLEAARTRYHQSSIRAKTYLLATLLGGFPVLSSSQIHGEIRSVVLGNFAGNKYARAVWDAYFGALSPDEKQLAVARVLARKPEGFEAQGWLQRLVDADILGFKTAAFLRVSGLVPLQLQAEFEGLVDRGSKPRRDEIVRLLRASLGNRLPALRSLGPVLESRGLSYTVAADFQLDDQIRKTAVRVLREGVGKRVQEATKIWKTTAAALEAGSDEDLMFPAVYIQEALDYAMETLGESGSEVDYTVDRALISKATNIYQRDGHTTSSGFAIKVVPVLDEIQIGIRSPFQHRVLIFPRIEGLEVAETLERKTARDIIDTELSAAYDFGMWDLETQEENWLVDKQIATLWRQDLSQLREVPLKNIQPQREILRLMLKPFLSLADRQQLAQATPVIFKLGSNETAFREKFQQVLESYGTPERNPTENLYFYRRKLAEELRQPVMFTREMLWYLQTVARNRVHAASVGRWGFYRSLVEVTGETRVGSMVNLGLRGLKSCAERLMPQRKKQAALSSN